MSDQTKSTKTPRELIAQCAEQLSADGHYELSLEIAALKAAQPVQPAAHNSGTATAAQWMPIETAPHGRKLIVGYHNKLGNWRTVMASYYAEETLPAPDYYHGDKEFADAGWFEECESNDEVIYPCEEEPTHWMPLPPPPATASGTDPAEVAR